MSRATLERYSHVGMMAKRKAVESLSLNEPNSNGVPTNSPNSRRFDADLVICK
jgi:hypothetical protein